MMNSDATARDAGRISIREEAESLERCQSFFQKKTERFRKGTRRLVKEAAVTGPGGLLSCPGMSNEELVQTFESNPERLLRVLEGLTEREMTIAPFMGKWSIQEIALHVVDTEIMAAARIRQTISDSERTFSIWDQAVWARRMEYQKASREEVAEALVLYGSLRRTSGYLLRRLPEEVWKRLGVHKRRGVEVTLRELVEHHTVHSEHHIGQILERRRILGREIELAPVIPVG